MRNLTSFAETKGVDCSQGTLFFIIIHMIIFLIPGANRKIVARSLNINILDTYNTVLLVRAL